MDLGLPFYDDMESAFLPDNMPIDAARTHLQLGMLECHVVNGGETKNIFLPLTNTIQELMATYYEEQKQFVSNLSFEGKVLTDENTQLVSLMRTGSPVILLVSSLRILIKDDKCGTEHSLFPSDTVTVSELMKDYFAACLRQPGQGDSLNVRMLSDVNMQADAKEIQAEELIALIGDETLYRMGRQHADISVLYYVNPPFSIQIEDDSNSRRNSHQQQHNGEQKGGGAVVLEVTDASTVESVKYQYSQQVTEGLIDKDVLIFVEKGLELDPQRMLYKYGIRDGSKLKVRRHEFGFTSTKYYCYQCGEPTKLSRDSVVQCRECGFRVLCKTRTSEPQQFIAR
jgi:DNA-directed RNA polymerase subunit RPC12/RpoP